MIATGGLSNSAHDLMLACSHAHLHVHTLTVTLQHYPVALHRGLKGDVGVLQQGTREGEMGGFMPTEPPGRQGGAYLGHTLERRIIKFGAVEISLMSANTAKCISMVQA